MRGYVKHVPALQHARHQLLGLLPQREQRSRCGLKQLPPDIVSAAV
jgi:hypothetical protein